jgi:hypothetical protein
MTVKLAVMVDGEPMEEGAARGFWERFSTHMEAHKGDLAGFAKAEGFASVHPSVGELGPSLVVSRTSAQAPYRNVTGGSDGHQSPSPKQGGKKNRSKK